MYQEKKGTLSPLWGQRYMFLVKHARNQGDFVSTPWGKCFYSLGKMYFPLRVFFVSNLETQILNFGIYVSDFRT